MPPPLLAAVRLDWGFGNPNITATLIAMLMVAVWALPAIARRWHTVAGEIAFWAALAGCGWLGRCLLLTRSRGGLVAALLGLGLVALFARRPWAKRHLAGALLAGALLAVSAKESGTSARLAPEHLADDASIGNRFKIWRHAPEMIADAPGGWGVGQGHKAYMAWYQDPDWNQDYETLVSTHITWLVEFGWAGRLAYVSAWALALRLAWPGRPRESGARNPAPGTQPAERPTEAAHTEPPAAPISTRRAVVPFATLAAFGTACVFSTVADPWQLWVLPVLAVTWTLAARALRREWPARRDLGITLATPTLGLLAILAPFLGRTGLHAYDGGQTVKMGPGEPSLILVAGEGTKESPRRLRALKAESGLPVTLLWTSRPAGVAVPAKPTPVALLGKPAGPEVSALVAQAPAVVLPAPPYSPGELFTPECLPKVRVFYGEFSSSAHARAWNATGRCESLPGMADFIADWPDRVLAVATPEKAN